MASSSFKTHKKYRWIALFAKLISKPLLELAFVNFTVVISVGVFGKQQLGAYLATLISLIIYYGIIFALNRKFNFRSNTSLFKSIAIYSAFVILLLAIESIYQTPIVNALYKLTNLGLKDPQQYICLANVNNKFVYLIFSLLIQFAFSFITGILIYFFYKFILDNERLLGKS